MFEEKYEEYVEYYERENIEYKISYVDMLRKLEKENIYITEWDNDKFNNFIKSFKFIVPKSIDKYTFIINELHQYICKKEKVIPARFYLINDINFYLDKEKLDSITLSVDEYNRLKEILNEYSVFDKLIIELAWQGVQSRHINCIEVNNIKFTNKSVIINVIDKQIVITDKETIEDIKTIIDTKQRYHFKKDEFYKLKESPYLFKPFIFNPNSKVNIDLVLKSNLVYLNEKNKIIEGKDFTALSISDIKRSAKLANNKNSLN